MSVDLAGLWFDQAAADDWDSVALLLRSAELPLAGAPEHLDDFVVCREGGRLIGVGGIEIYGKSALLRSIAVAPSHRGRGVGRELVRRLLERAVGRGVREVGLLTATADAYFTDLGFARVARDDLPRDLGASAELQGACCDTATAMLRALEP